MHKKIGSFLALLLAVVMLAGCAAPLDREVIERNRGAVDYADMEYKRPQMDQLEKKLEECCQIARTETNIHKVMDAVYEYYDAYDWYFTHYNLAYIRYHGDLTDEYWANEYSICDQNSDALDAGLDTLYRALAQSPIRDKLEGEGYFGPGFFDAYEGESIWDQQFLEYMEAESALISRYYELSAQTLDMEPGTTEYYDTWADDLGGIYVDLVALRQEIAAYAGYDSYPQFAYDFYFYREFTAEQTADYLPRLREALVPLYRQMARSDVWDVGMKACDSKEMFRFVQDMAAKMGGLINGAFLLMDGAELHDIADSPNKYDTAFSLYLTGYYEPFLFMKPAGNQWDKLTLAHEFGHFTHDYVCWGTYAGTDVAEVLSQGMEYLALCYGKDTEELTRMKLLDCLCVYVEQAAYADFEHQVYGLTGEELTVENVTALFERVSASYGFDEWDWDVRAWVEVPHFYVQPMYIISYVVSNDAAFQLYQMELAESGSGLSAYKECLYAEDTLFLAFLERMGLEDPFDDHRLDTVRQTLENALK